MDKVCYFLGAGFSAPIGLPVMGNFLVKSKDMYFEDRDKFNHFKEVFDSINRLSVAKNYYDTDLFNIEEILSILEMGSFLEGRKLEKSFLQYIKDVIRFFTPDIEPHGALSGNWQSFIFGNRAEWRYYGHFLGCLFNLRFYEHKVLGPPKERSYHVVRIKSPNTAYSVITLNYDLILEKLCSFINENYERKERLGFVHSNLLDEGHNWATPGIAKLHGSVDNEIIVAPTWSKGVNKEITPAWKAAYQLLVSANFIRFIGYSLPISDAYVKYLLKSAVLKSPHLKGIDVLCRDSDGGVKKHYDEFIDFTNYRFVNADVRDYLEFNYNIHNANIRHAPKEIFLDKLEEAHDKFFEERF